MMRRLILSLGLICSCSTELAEPFQVGALEPTVVVPGSPLSLTLKGSTSAITIDYGAGERSGAWAAASILGAEAPIPLPLESKSAGVFNGIVPDGLVAPSNQYQVRLSASGDAFDFPLTVLGIDAQISGCRPGQPRLLDVSLVDANGRPTLPGEAVVVTTAGDGLLYEPDCATPSTGEARVGGTESSPATQQYCLKDAAQVSVQAGYLRKQITNERPFRGELALKVESDLSSGECVLVKLDCQDCAPLVQVSIFGPGGTRIEAPIYNDPSCAEPVPPGATSVYLRMPTEPGEYELHGGGCDYRASAKVQVHPTLRTIPAIALGVPFPIEVPADCQPTADLVSITPVGPTSPSLFVVLGRQALAGQSLRIRCGTEPRAALSAPVTLSWCDQAQPPLHVSLEPAAIGGPVGSQANVNFHLEQDGPFRGVAVLLEPTRGADLVWTERRPICDGSYCFSRRYPISIAASAVLPRVLEPAVYVWDGQGCLSVTERALVEAPLASIFTVTATGSGARQGDLAAALSWLENADENAPPAVLRFRRGLSVRGNSPVVDRPLYVVGDGAELAFESLKISGNAAGSFLSGLSLQLGQLRVEADSVQIRDSVLEGDLNGNGEGLLASVGAELELGPGNVLRSQNQDGALLLSGGARSHIHDNQLEGGRIGLVLTSAGVVERNVILGALELGVSIEVNDGAQAMELRHLTIDVPRDGIASSTALVVGDSIVRAGRNALSNQGPGQTVALRSWLDPARASSLPAGRITDDVFVNAAGFDYRLAYGAYPVDPEVCANGPCPALVDLNGHLPGTFNGLFPDLGALEASYSFEP